MRILVKIFLLFGLVLSIASAQEQIKAIKVPGNVSKIGPLSKAWLSAEYTNVILYPNTTTKMISTDISIEKDNLKAKQVKVKALYDGENISFLLEWKDNTKNIQKKCCSKTNADGFVLQFPVSYNDMTRLPYVSMGNNGRRVIVHLKEATANESQLSENDAIYFSELKEYFDASKAQISTHKTVDYGHIFSMEGLGFIEENKDENSLVLMQMIYKDGFWKGTLSRPLKTSYLDLNNGAFPMSFVTWDGNNSNEIEYLSSWTGVKLVGKRDGDELLENLQGEFDGDIQNGKKLALENCAACHNFAQSITAPSYMAPNLSNIGGYATSSYIKESIVNPNAVLVPNYKSSLNPDFPWYSTNEDGNLTSTMPSYDWMDEQSIKDLVAYFKTLKAELE